MLLPHARGRLIGILRILHTADWHLGHTLADIPREHEHELFLDWLLELIKREEVDAILMAGDVFETANPPASAMELFYRFLARARQASPSLALVFIGGNHDSAARLDAPNPLLEAFGIHMVGGLPRHSDGSLNLDRALVPLCDAGGQIAAWVAAVPFLRAADLPAVDPESGDALIEGVRRVYAEVLDAARARREPGQALIGMGHCYMVGTVISELSERKILGGNQHPLPISIFPNDVTYVALGHLHLPQTVGGRDNVRYSGSPIPLSLSEAPYPHQVVVVDLDGERVTRLKPIAVPRSVPLIRLPPTGAFAPDDAVAALTSLTCSPDKPRATWPYLEVAVHIPKPDPSLGSRVEEALKGKGVRLVKLSVTTAGTGQTLHEAAPLTTLRDLTHEQVFAAMWGSRYEGVPPPEVLAAFHELVDQTQQEGA